MRLIDSDALIDNIRLGATDEGTISVITLLEVLRGVDEGKRREVKELLEASYRVKGVDNEVVLLACSLYGKVKKAGEPVPDADLIIAATAIASDLPLETGDAHFQRLTKYGLKLVER
ncbi:MAG: PIN domain-containing protein [Candidatus Bathyarchaeota archaeon]|nr:PIN domain-containing protein [Candidatus Bathyarchaeota archaeon]